MFTTGTGLKESIWIPVGRCLGQRHIFCFVYFEGINRSAVDSLKACRAGQLLVYPSQLLSTNQANWLGVSHPGVNWGSVHTPVQQVRQRDSEL